MDDTTRAVRELYEQYPYPSGEPEIRLGFDVRLLLSYGRLSGQPGRPLRALDAGCGRGLGLIGGAVLQPDVSFVGVDMNRVALAEANTLAKRWGLTNVRFQEVDLVNLEGLEVPAGGFDVIYSSGVVHSMADPAAGLRQLRGVLAPHGVLAFMVYGSNRRHSIERVTRALEAFLPADAALKDRLALGRQLVLTLAMATEDEVWREATVADDIEFVDRYLHVQETSYDVGELWHLIDEGGLAFLRWLAPEQWAVERFLPDGPLRQRVNALAQMERYRFVEQLVRTLRLECCLCHPDNGPRPPVAPADLERTVFAVSPEVVFELTTRSAWGNRRREQLAYRRRTDDPIPLPKGPMATAGLILRDQNRPLSGTELIDRLAKRGVARPESLQTLAALLDQEIIYRPHEAELAPTSGIRDEE